MTQFQQKLAFLGFATYEDYLNSDHWKMFRLQYRSSGRSVRCAVCENVVIELHHKTYVRLGAERLDDVVPLCRTHHEGVHQWLQTSGRRWVEYTHEAISALRGELPPPKDVVKGPKYPPPAKEKDRWVFRDGSARVVKGVHKKKKLPPKVYKNLPPDDKCEVDELFAGGFLTVSEYDSIRSTHRTKRFNQYRGHGRDRKRKGIQANPT